jgi:hypothetical protein
MLYVDRAFEQRVGNLAVKHRRMARGIAHRMDRNGLVTAIPRRRMPSFPLRGLMILLAAAFLFKAFLFATLGGSVYEQRVAQLSAGSIVEQGGAWVMQADPATIWVAAQINALLV